MGTATASSLVVGGSNLSPAAVTFASNLSPAVTFASNLSPAVTYGSNTAYFASNAVMTSINATAVTSGTLAVARGGTGATATTGTSSNVLNVGPTLSGAFLLGSTVTADIAASNITASNITATGSITANGNITAYSDMRLKSDLRVIEDATAKVSSLSGYTYLRSDQPGNLQRYVGVVAQEVHAVLPELVSIDGDTGLMSVAYGNMVALLIQSVKELSTRVASLEARYKD